MKKTGHALACIQSTNPDTPGMCLTHGRSSDVCVFCRAPFEDEQYRAKPERVNSKLSAGACNPCRMDDERELSGVDR